MIAELLPADAPIPEGAEALQNEVSALGDRVRALEIVTEADHGLACELVRQLDAGLKRAEAATQPAVEAALASHRAALRTKKYFCEPLESAKKVLKDKIGCWRAEQRRLADQESARLRGLAQKQAEDEALLRAARLEERGQQGAALALLDRPVVAPVVVASPKIVAGGVVSREVWSACVIDLAALILWVAEDIGTRSCYLQAAEPALNSVARAQKESMQIPGVVPVRRYA